MENENGSQSNTVQENPVGDTTSNGVNDSTVTEGLNGGAPEGDQQGADAGQTEGDANATGEKPHEEAIPYERWKPEHDELMKFRELIESAKSDPEAKSQLAQMFGLEAKQPDQTPQPTVTPFKEFLAKSVDPQMHPHYEGVFGAFAQEQEARMEEMLAPVMAYIGQSRLKEVESKNPDFGKYQAQVAESMKKHPTLDPEEALAIAAYQDRVKAAALSGQKKEQSRQQAMNRSPMTKSNGAPGATPQPPPRTAREMVERSWNKLQQAPA